MDLIESKKIKKEKYFLGKIDVREYLDAVSSTKVWLTYIKEEDYMDKKRIKESAIFETEHNLSLNNQRYIKYSRGDGACRVISSGEGEIETPPKEKEWVESEKSLVALLEPLPEYIKDIFNF